MRILLGAVVVSMLGCAHAPAPPERASAEVTDRLRRFLDAFERLDWEPFRAIFTDDACVFFPSAATPERFCGRAAVEARFQKEFEKIRAGSSGPRFMHLEPVGLQVTPIDGAVLVTFELRNSERIARRTMVFVERRREWRIVHLHASNVPWPAD